jgi:hypothetical protein
MTSIKEEISKAAKESGFGLFSRALASDDYELAARVFVPGERPLRVFSSLGLRIPTDRRILCVDPASRQLPNLRSYWYVGIGKLRPNRQVLNNGVAIFYEGAEHVVGLSKKDIDLAVAQITELLPADAGRTTFTSTAAVINFLRSELLEPLPERRPRADQGERQQAVLLGSV